MQEKISYEGEGLGNIANGSFGVKQFVWYETKISFGTGQNVIAAEGACIEEDQYVYDDDGHGDKLKADHSQRCVIMEGQEHSCCLADKQFICEIEHDEGDDQINAAPNDGF